MDLALNNLQRWVCQKNQTNQLNPTWIQMVSLFARNYKYINLD